MSTAPRPGRRRREEARGRGAREPRAVAGVLRRHGHPADVPVHRAVRDEPGRQGEVRPARQRAVRRASAPRSPPCPATTPEGSVLDGLPGAVDIASALPPEETVDQAEVDKAAAKAAARAVAAGGRRGGQGLRGASTVAEKKIDAALTPPASPTPRGTRSTSAVWWCTSSPTQVLFDAEQAVLRPEGRADPGRRRADADRPAQRAARRGPRQPPAGDPGRPVAVELGAVEPTGPPPCCATWPATACRSRACRRPATPSTRPLVPITDPTAITVNRRVDIVVLSTASAEANALLPGIAASHRGATP